MSQMQFALARKWFSFLCKIFYILSLWLNVGNFQIRSNPIKSDLSDKTQRCDHSNESSLWVNCNGTARVITEQRSFSFLFLRNIFKKTIISRYKKLRVFFRFQITFVKDVGWIWFKLKRKSNPPIEQHSARASRHHAAVVKSIPDEGSAMADRYPIRTLYKNIIQTRPIIFIVRATS